jgi:hypothetical protein
MARKRLPLRQGDVLLVPIAPSRIPAGRVVPRDRGRIVLAYGEVTGHAHAIDSATAVLTETDTDRRLRGSPSCGSWSRRSFVAD